MCIFAQEHRYNPLIWLNARDWRVNRGLTKGKGYRFYLETHTLFTLHGHFISPLYNFFSQKAHKKGITIACLKQMYIFICRFFITFKCFQKEMQQACIKLLFPPNLAFRIIYSINPFPNKPWFLSVCSTRLLKTLWEKEKLLVTSNFSFSPQCFLPVWITFCHFCQI